MIDISRAQERLRREAILRALYTVWPKPLSGALLADSLPDDLSGSHAALDRDLDYLCERGQIHLTRRDAQPIATLTADGVDQVEAHPDFDRARRRGLRLLRLRVLQALDWGRPQPMGSRLIARALAEDTDLDLSEPSLLLALEYLEARGLAARGRPDLARITPDGVDYLAGDGRDNPGIATPVEW